MAIKNERLTTTQLDLLEVPAGKSYAITNVIVCNTNANNSGLDAYFDMHLIANGDALSDIKTMIVANLNLPAGESFTFDSERIVLEAGDKISFVAGPDNGGGDAGNTNLSATVSFLEV